MEKSRAGPPTKRRAAPFPFAKPSDGMLNWRHGRTRGLPDNYSGPSRDVSSQALNGFLTGFGRQRARGARVEPQLAKSGGYDPTFTKRTTSGGARPRAVRVSRPGVESCRTVCA